MFCWMFTWRPKLQTLACQDGFMKDNPEFSLKALLAQGDILHQKSYRGEISFKSDIFSLGIIVIKLLTGSDTYDFDNWYKSIDVNSPQVEWCIKIALTCVDTNQHNRPSIDEIIHKLNGMDSVEESRDDPGSSIHQVSASALKELPPSMSCVDNQDGEKIKHKRPTEDTSLAKNDSLKGQKGSRDAKKMAPTPQWPAGLKMPSSPPPPPIIIQRMEDPCNHFDSPPPPPPPIIIQRMEPPPPPPIIIQRMENPCNHFDSSDDEFDDFDDSDDFCEEEAQRIPHQRRCHNGGLNDKARPANAGGGGKKIPVDGGGSNKAGGKDRKTDFVKGDRTPTSGDHPRQGKMGNVASVPTVAVHSPMVGMLPEQFMMRQPNTMDVRPWSVPYPLQGGQGGEGGVLTGREVLQVAAAAQNSMALQQHMALMQQQHMAFYLFSFMFLFLFTIIIIVIVILTFKKRG